MHTYVPITMTTDTGPENGSARGCLNCRSLFLKIRQRSEKWREAAGRLEGLSSLLGVEMSPSLQRRQTKLQVNKGKGKKQEADITEKKSRVLRQRLQPNQSNSQGSHIDCEASCHLLFDALCTFGLAGKRSQMFLSLLFFVSAAVNGNVVLRGKEMRVAGNHNSLTSSVWAGTPRAVLKCRALSSSSST